MTEQFLSRTAELYRCSDGMALAPDPPMWLTAGKIAEGTLLEMLNQWSEFPASHRPNHVIAVQGVQLREKEIRKILAEK